MHIDDFYTLANRVYNLYDNGLINADLTVKGVWSVEALQEVSPTYLSLLDVARDLNAVRGMLNSTPVDGRGNPTPHIYPPKNPAAVALGHLGGLRGGPARAEALTPERRSEIARKAAEARWGRSEQACSAGDKGCGETPCICQPDEEEEECNGDCGGRCEYCFEKAIDDADMLMEQMRDEEMGL